mgnify:CR=1 FL=1
MSITQSRIAEILYSLATNADADDIILSLAEYDEATTDRIDPDYGGDRFALTDGTMIEYIPGKFGGWKVADASRVAEWLDDADERDSEEAAELASAEAEDAEADAITLERDQVRGTEYESRYADANNHGLRYIMQVLAAAARGDEDAIRELADLDADAQG